MRVPDRCLVYHSFPNGLETEGKGHPKLVVQELEHKGFIPSHPHSLYVLFLGLPCGLSLKRCGTLQIFEFAQLRPLLNHWEKKKKCYSSTVNTTKPLKVRCLAERLCSSVPQLPYCSVLATFLLYYWKPAVFLSSLLLFIVYCLLLRR